MRDHINFHIVRKQAQRMRQILFTLVVSVVLELGTSSGLKNVALICPKNCTCEWNDGKPVSVSCLGGQISANSPNSSSEPDFIRLLCNPSSSKFSRVKSVRLVGCKLSTSCLDCLVRVITNLRFLSIIDSEVDPSALWEDLSRLNALKFLNFSGSNIAEVNLPPTLHFSKLQTLDLSNNRVSAISIPNGKILPNLEKLLLQNNQLSHWAVDENVPMKRLDISHNPLINLNHLRLPNKLEQVIAQNVSFAKSFDSQCRDGECAIIFPSSLVFLDLQLNNLTAVPSCNGLLSGVTPRKLDLSRNHISHVFADTLKSPCFQQLQALLLNDNDLLRIDSNAFDNLHRLSEIGLSGNYMQHISQMLISKVLDNQNNQLVNPDKLQTLDNSINLQNNPWSCDCFMHDLHAWMSNFSSSNLQITCENPPELFGMKLQDVELENMTCSAPTLLEANDGNAQENQDGELSCKFAGVPIPDVRWSTPHDNEVSAASLANDTSQQERFSLSPRGDVLTAHKVVLSKTGHFRCIAENGVGSANTTVVLGVVLSHTSTLILLAVACVTFMIAMVVNSINLCMYVCYHIQLKQQIRKERRNFKKLNSPLQEKMFDKSIASLSANSHYSKYDYTCQQMFLDTVIRGAHTVKKTWYDARNSDFSVHVWDYASSLRTRLHNMDMPSTSFHIPTMQNIEKMGTNMLQRSHNLASSVGSVFTLKYWTTQSPHHPQHQAASDADSTDSRACVEVNSTTSEPTQKIAVEVYMVPPAQHPPGRDPAATQDPTDPCTPHIAGLGVYFPFCHVTDTQPPCDVIQPPSHHGDVIQPPCDVIPSPCDVVSSPCDVTQPPCDVTQPPCDATQPPCDVIPSPYDVTQQFQAPCDVTQQAPPTCDVIQQAPPPGDVTNVQATPLTHDVTNVQAGLYDVTSTQGGLYDVTSTQGGLYDVTSTRGGLYDVTTSVRVATGEYYDPATKYESGDSPAVCLLYETSL